MRIAYTTAHRGHDPGHEFSRDGLIPYPESPARAERILAAVGAAGLGEVAEPRPCPASALEAVHDPDYLRFLQEAGPAWAAAGGAGASLAANTFAARRTGRRPPDPIDQLGYYAFDTTPMTVGTWEAARAAVGCALTGAEWLLAGERTAFALCRPPGHHAGRDFCGGYCFLNNAAAAAAHLSERGRVAILDLDYHHGNGTQDIFYATDAVFVVSVHADPAHAYPLFWGYAEERGTGAGLGYNRNLPLPGGADDGLYLAAVDEALELVGRTAPEFLVVSAGLDVCAGDPIGDFVVSMEGLAAVGSRVAGMDLPTLVVQEGGYGLERLGAAAVALLTPLAD